MFYTISIRKTRSGAKRLRVRSNAKSSEGMGKESTSCIIIQLYVNIFNTYGHNLQTQAASPRKTPLTQLTTEFLVLNFKAMLLFSQVIRDSSTVYLLCIY